MSVDSYIDSLLDQPRRRPARRARPQAMSPEERSSLIGRVGGQALSGLAAVGNVLDLPGSSVRDLIAGENPLDQWIDPFGRRADQNRTTGRDLLRDGGAIGSKDTWGNFAGGLGTEVLLDPLTYLTLGSSALVKGAQSGGKVGQAAKAAGKLPGTLAEQIAGGHRGLVGIRAPFSSNVLPLGTGKTAQKVAGVIDSASDAVRYSRPGKLWNRLFDAELGGTTTAPVQKLAKSLAPERAAETAKARGFGASVVRNLIDNDLIDAKHGDALRRTLEGTRRAGDPNFDAGMINRVVSENADLLREAQDLGMDVEAFRDSTNLGYFQRYLSAEGGSKMFKKRVLSTVDQSQIGREWYMRDIEGGTDMIQRIARDADVEALISRGAKPAAIRDAITGKFGNVFKGNADHSAKQHGSRFVQSLMGMTPETRAAGVFGNHPVADMMHGMTSRRDAITVSKGIVNFLEQADFLSDVNAPGMRPIKDVMEKMKLSGNPLTGSGKFIPEEIAADLERLQQGFTQPDSVNDVIKAVDTVTNLFKAGVTGVWPAFHTRNLVSGQWMNWVSGEFSLGSVRDAGRLLKGETIEGAASIPAVAAELTRRGLSGDKAGTDVLADLAFAHELIGKFEGQAVDVAGAANVGVKGIGDILDAIPGINPTKGTIGHAIDVPTYLGARKGLSRNPLKTRGVGDLKESAFGPAKWGENLGHQVEGLNRLSPFIHQLRKGVDPAVAAEKVGTVQVLYGGKHYTPFESEKLARLMPFFKFTSRMLPYQLRMLFDEPGGKLAQTLRATNRGRNPDEVTPDYVAETAAVGLGRKEDGTARYLTGFGLPFEDSLSFLTPDVRSVGMEALSRTNPLVKAPLEYLTNQSFFQRGANGGRALDDLDPTIGRTIANIGERLGGERPRQAEPLLGSSALEFILANSPLSRALTTARTASDPRKGIGATAANLLTGFRITDVSPAAQDAILRERAEGAMKGLGGRAFERTSISDETIATLPPEEQIQALRLRALMNELAQRAKARRK